MLTCSLGTIRRHLGDSWTVVGMHLNLPMAQASTPVGPLSNVFWPTVVASDLSDVRLILLAGYP